MKEFIFELEGERALIIRAERLGCDRARFRLTTPVPGDLTIGARRFPLTAEGAEVPADGLQTGIHTPVFFAEGKRFEGPPFLISGGCMHLLPPGKEECIALERALKGSLARVEALERRIQALETRLTDTSIF